MISLEWEEKDSDAYLDANSFSDGTLRFIALTTLLLQPNLPDTIIIDEPELGLHPTAINKFAALVRRAAQKKQIILATQSVNLWLIERTSKRYSTDWKRILLTLGWKNITLVTSGKRTL